MTAPALPEWPAHIKVGTKGFVCSGCMKYTGLDPDEAVAQARLHLIKRHGYVAQADVVATVVGCGLDPATAAAVVDELQQQFRILRRLPCS